MPTQTRDTSAAERPDAACCGPAEQAACCAPEEKTGCCGSAAEAPAAAGPGGPTRCGCR